jgi:nitrogen fixation protein NifU and related proteins
MTLLSAVVAFLVLLVVGLAWFFLYYFNNQTLDNPDGVARVVGNCGDTMEIGLQIRNGQVVNCHCWTNGCSFSKNCVEAAAALARGKSLADLRRVNMVTIIDRVGQLPETHLHCAQLAEITLQRSLENYLEKGRQPPETATKS